MASDVQYADLEYDPSEIDHEYDADLHIQENPLALSELARLCSPEVGQPAFNSLLETLYGRLLETIVNGEFPRTGESIPTRMRESTERGVYTGDVIDPSTEVVTVDVARAGMIPSNVFFEQLTEILDPDGVRQDHVFMSRVTDEEGQVTGADIWGEKVGGDVDGKIVLLPDPMGATGSSMARAIDYYRNEVGGQARHVVTANLIVTPEFVRRIDREHPEVTMYAMRLDRGMSTPDALERPPGASDEESGLDAHDYIVPGGGGFGEIINNSWT
ncbi:MAG: uracil phosphoribosyltransferase [Bradymonadaceae bacterium]